MKRIPLRSRLTSVAFVILAGLAWIYLAPTQIGGATTYLKTSGISMEPRFHAGDLAVVRPADHYSVGEVVAYRSTLLHTIILHRIVARDGDRYVFKGDNNNFLDPVHPTRSELVGALWLHISGGGRVLTWLHSPPVVAVVLGVVFLLLIGAGEERRRRDRRGGRRGGSGRAGGRSMSGRDDIAGVPSDNQGLLAAAAAVAVCFLLAVFAFSRPLSNPATTKVSYSQSVSFGYSASAPAGPVYPNGIVSTGAPIFLSLVHQLRVQVDYALTTIAPHAVAGTEAVLVRLTGPGGWTRSWQITPTVRFSGDRASAAVTLGLPYLQSVFAQVARLTGAPPMAGYTIAVVPQIRVGGTLAGRPLTASYDPILSFQFEGVQLMPGAGSSASASGGTPSGLSSSQSGSVSQAATTPNVISVLGRRLEIATLRWLSLFGLLVAGATALLLLQLKRREPFAEVARIQSRYGHLIVPIVGPADLTGRPVFDVASIKALVALAERSERLILHQYGDSADTFLVDDEGTIYRYRTRPTGVVWSDRPAMPQAARPANRPPAWQNGGGAAGGREAVTVVATGDGIRPAPDPPHDLAASADSSRRDPAAARTAGLRRPAPLSPLVGVRVDDARRRDTAAAAGAGAVHPVVPIAPVLRVPPNGPSSSAGAVSEGAWLRAVPVASVACGPVSEPSPERPFEAVGEGAGPGPVPVASVDAASVGESSPERSVEAVGEGAGPGPVPVASVDAASVGESSPERSVEAVGEGAGPGPVPVASVDAASVGESSPERSVDRVGEGAAPGPVPVAPADPASVADPPRVRTTFATDPPRPHSRPVGWRSRVQSGRGLWGEIHRKLREDR